MLYFTSGTTARPKLVEHTHVSYPVGHLATMFWIGLRPGDVHLNISSPGWAKHAWSNFFAPWNAEATVFLYNYTRFDAGRLMEVMDRAGVTSFCAPPTVWRMLIQADLTQLRDAAARGRRRGGAAEPRGHRAGAARLGRHHPGRVRADGDGRPGLQQPRSGAEDRLHGAPQPRLQGGAAGPGHRRTRRQEGEISLDLSERPVGLMAGYHGDPERTAEAMAGGYYRTGDIGSRDADGYITYVGRVGRRVQGVRLQDLAVRAGERAPGARGGRRGGGRARPRRAAARRPQGVRRPRRGATSPGPTPRSCSSSTRGTVLAPYKRVRRLEFARAAEDRLRQDPPDRAARGHGAGSDAEYREEDFR